MLAQERQNFILQQISRHNKVLVVDLVRSLNVSLDTVRRDLNELKRDGKIVKVHGGAISTTFHQPFQQSKVYAQEQKKAIAKKALKLIRNDMVIVMGGGTVMVELARLIPPDLKGTLFTVSPLVALEVTQRSGVNVILLAGQLSRNAYICTGATVVSQLSELHADLCFLGANGLSKKEGLTDNDWDVVQVKKAMIRSAAKTAVLSLSEKIGTVQKIRSSTLKAVDYLVTELHGTDAKLKAYAPLVQLL